MYGFDDRYMDDCHYDGGQLQVYDIGRYGTRMLATNALPPYPESAGARWTEMWKERLEESESWLIHWLSHQTDGPYWRRGSVRDQIADIDCAVLMWGGWQDGYINPIFRMYPKLRGPKRVIIGPWMHSRPDIGPPGPLVDWLDETTRWWDQWLKGTDTGVMDLPPVVFYMQQFDPPCSDRKHTSGYWRQADTLRPPSAKTLTMKLRAGGQMGRDANTRPGQDRLKCDATTGLYAGEFSAGGLPWFGLPLDQAAGEDRALVYTGSPLEGPVEIFGNPSVRLYVSATARVAVFAARLCDVAPDGQAALVSKGVLNATRRDSFVAPEPLEPDSVYQLDIDLNATAWRFEPGHRIRLCVSNAEFPRLWPTPEPLVSTLYRSEQHPSCLRLPIISVGDPSRAATPLTVLERAEPEEHGLENPYQRAVRDLLNDAVEVQAGFTQKVILDTGVEVSDRREFTTRVSNREPARAHATGHTEIQLRRGDWSVIADARSDVTSSSDALHVVQNLRVWLNGELFHDRRWRQSIPRDLL
jgi:predicted acyl esterase